MPYTIRKQKCTQSDGDKGTYVLSYTTKKGKKVRNCHTSKKKAQGQIAAIEGPWESDSSNMNMIEETQTFQSHSRVPDVGQNVMNVNPGCQHYGSEGYVLSVDSLPGDAGVTCTYCCTNSGETWDEGDVLVKTLDQIAPLGITESHLRHFSPDFAYHHRRGIPVNENVFRPGSWRYFSLIREARDLAASGAYNPTKGERSILRDTDVGEFDLYEGRLVPLDFPMPSRVDYDLHELKEAEYDGRDVDLNKPMRGEASHHGGRLVHLDWPEPISEATRPTGALDYIHFTSADHARQIAADRCLLESEITPGVYAVAVGGVSVPGLQKTRLGRVKEERDSAVIFRTKALPKIAHPEEVIWSGQTCSGGRRGIDIEVLDVIPASAAVAMLDDSLPTHVPPGAFHEVLAIPQEYYGKIGYEPGLQEAKYDGRDVELNKPMRGDTKKYKVYVKNDKGNVIKVEFGDAKGGMTQKIQDMGRRRAFGDRHNCDQKDDKTKPGYWSCRLPRYWKELGFKKPPNPNGEWW